MARGDYTLQKPAKKQRAAAQPALIEQALALAKLGFEVVPANERHPIIAEWQKVATSDLAQIRRCRQYARASAVAIVVRADGDYWALDADVPKWLQQAWGKQLPKTATVRSGGGGLHLYFQHDAYSRERLSPLGVAKIPNSSNGAGGGRQYLLELFAATHALHAPGAVHHETGKTYVWAPGGKMRPRPALRAFVDFLVKQPWAGKNGAANGSQESSQQLTCRVKDDKDVEALFAGLEFKKKTTPQGLKFHPARPDVCPASGHQHRGGSSSVWVFLYTAATRQLRFHCDGGGVCAAEAEKDHTRAALEALGVDAQEWLAGDPGLLEPDPGEGGADWIKQLMVGTKGRYGNLTNYALVLTHGAWKDVLVYNLWTNRIEITDSAPPGITQGVLEDHIIHEVRSWMERHYQPKIQRAILLEASEFGARQHSYHPLRDYLNGLVWDGTERLSRLLKDYFGVKVVDEEAVHLAGLVSRRFPVSAVARVFQPGAKVDHMLVLLGSQDLGKSLGLKELFGEENYTDHIAALDSKDAAIDLNGKWVVEFAEFDRLARTEPSTIKAWLSRTTDHYRSPYGRIAADWPRQTVFTGTINLDQFLVDDQNRRYWPFQCVAKVDLEAIKRDRDQLWAEAVKLYRDGFRWWPQDEAEVRALTGLQGERRVENVLASPIKNWLESSITLAAIDKCGEKWLTSAEILEGIQIPIAQYKSHYMALSSAMRELGYTQERLKRGEPRFWRRMTADEAAAAGVTVAKRKQARKEKRGEFGTKEYWDRKSAPGKVQ